MARTGPKTGPAGGLARRFTCNLSKGDGSRKGANGPRAQSCLTNGFSKNATTDGPETAGTRPWERIMHGRRRLAIPLVTLPGLSVPRLSPAFIIHHSSFILSHHPPPFAPSPPSQGRPALAPAAWRGPLRRPRFSRHWGPIRNRNPCPNAPYSPLCVVSTPERGRLRPPPQISRERGPGFSRMSAAVGRLRGGVQLPEFSSARDGSAESSS